MSLQSNHSPKKNETRLTQYVESEIYEYGINIWIKQEFEKKTSDHKYHLHSQKIMANTFIITDWKILGLLVKFLNLITQEKSKFCQYFLQINIEPNNWIFRIFKKKIFIKLLVTANLTWKLREYTYIPKWLLQTELNRKKL